MSQPTSPPGAVNPQAALGFDPLSCRGLYIGNLDPKVTDALLFDIFSTIGPIEGCKIIKDKNGNSSGYGFVDYYDHFTADKALQNLNGRKIYNTEIKVNWAHAANQKEDTTSGHYHIFVGDLSPEIDEKALYLAFLAFGSCSDARVMWDQNTGRSRGYGFVAFRKKEDAEKALTAMNGEWLGNRAIRCNWANQKVTSSQTPSSDNMNDYNNVVNQTPPSNTTVYIGNLSPDVTDEQLLRTIFEEYGQIQEIRMQKDKGFAFLRFGSHEQAARSICSVHGRAIGSKVVKCSWGKERSDSGSPQTFSTPISTSYSYPQPIQYPGASPYTYPYYNPSYAYNTQASYPYVSGYPPYGGDPYSGN